MEMLTPEPVVTEKKCGACHEVKSATDFPVRRSSKDGLYALCKECAAAKTREWRARNPEAARASERKWREKNADMVRASNTEWHRGWREKNRERDRAAARKWKASNPDRVRQAARERAKAYPELYASYAAKRRAQVMNATPPWLTGDHLRRMAEFYREAKRLTEETGVEYNVDHIAPLRGRNSSGLHVPWNLQVITAEANRRKWVHEPSGS